MHSSHLETSNELIALIILYQLVHFYIECITNILYWRNLYTGTKLNHVTVGTFSNEKLDYPSNPKHSSLYNWWYEKNIPITKLEKIHIGFLSTIEEIKNNIFNLTKQPDEINLMQNIEVKLNELLCRSNLIETEIVKIRNILEDERIKISLKRYEKWVRKLISIQGFKWIILETLIPLAVGVYALGLLICQIITIT